MEAAHGVTDQTISGPFSLQYLHMFISQRSPGAFILSKRGRAADFVGASPDDLAGSIRESIKQTGYRYFWFAYAKNAREAFRLERAWHHRFRPTDNQAPPPRATDDDWRCTTEGCATCALTYSAS